MLSAVQADNIAFIQERPAAHDQPLLARKALHDFHGFATAAARHDPAQRDFRRFPRPDDFHHMAVPVNNQVDAHEKAVELFKKEAASSDKPELKAFASDKLPTLQHHLEQAKALQATHGK